MTRPDLFVLDDHLGRQDGRAPALLDLAAMLHCPTPPVAMDSSTDVQRQWLRNQPDGSVDVISLGALSAVDDLIDADPALAARKVRRLVVVAGDAAPGAPVEYNVSQDPAAFVDVMTSGLAVWWIPAFDGGLWQGGTASYTRSTDEELLSGVHPEVGRWFDKYIGARYGLRNLWAAGLLIDLESPTGAQWREESPSWDDSGSLTDAGGRGSSIRRLSVTDREAFEAGVVRSTNAALRELSPRTCPS
jgi:hypothetical protein